MNTLDLVSHIYDKIVLTDVGLLLPQIEHFSLAAILFDAALESPSSVSLISHGHLKPVYVTGMRSSNAELPVGPLCAIPVSINVSRLYHPTLPRPMPSVEVDLQTESISVNGTTLLTENTKVFDCVCQKWETRI